jgi:hypothetical protein
MKAISIFNGLDIFSIESCIELSKEFMKDREFVKNNLTPKWFISEIYGHLKKAGELPELSRERKIELWEESGKDKLLYLSLYVIEII